MYRKPTRDEIAKSWALWMDYVDPHATMAQAEFDAMPMDEKLAIMTECFGPESATEDQ